MIQAGFDEYTCSIIGVMSGTSLDGLDLAFCTFTGEGKNLSYTLGDCCTIPYPAEWRKRLLSLPVAGAIEYAAAHAEYGKYIGQRVREFIGKYSLQADYVASHGHTIFHQPGLGFTSQIGDGAAIAASCGLPVICDFRSADVAHGGQGAPLVPAGDELLFGEFSHCLNLGGFANLSFTRENSRIAFDICPANFVLNHLAGKTGLEYDQDGRLASTGHVNEQLLAKLNGLPFYSKEPPKSLGREWVESELLSLLELSETGICDQLCTVVEHIAIQIGKCLAKSPADRLLITGGGAYNRFLIGRIETYSCLPIVLPEEKIIEYKEALIFALLGLLRLQQKPNCRKSVTGASADVCAGAIYLP